MAAKKHADIGLCSQFKIGGFSVGNISLAVSVAKSQPSVEISGDLTFPIEDNKKLKLALGPLGGDL